jgi:photosystem II stability/assembly factor-like uncharacterized protein
MASMGLLATACVTIALTHANPEASRAPLKIEASWTDAFEWRCIGPANMGGRITDIAVYEADPTTYYVATASGGLLKTTNNGVTFEHQFDEESTVSIGAVDVAQTNPDIVWVGTGESNPRNSVSWGDGVYKSVDGGETWRNMGLKDSYHTGQILIHPENPDIVYVGAMGRNWGENEERGLYKTTDGGETWDKILYIDQATGVIDMAMHPEDPDTVLVATWERQRDGFDTNDPAKKWGPGSALYKTTDAGASFTRITDGLPSVYLGRLGIAFSRSEPDIVYMTVDSERIGTVSEKLGYMGITGEDADAGARLTEIIEEGPAAEAGLLVDDIVLMVGETPVLSYDGLIAEISKRQAGDKMTLTVSRNRESVRIDLTLGTRSEEGSDERPFGTRLGGQRPNIQDEQGPDSHERGGLYKSYDAGTSWERVNSYNPRPMYFSKLGVDPNDSDRIYILGISLGISDDGGKTIRTGQARGVHADHHAIWINPDSSDHIVFGTDGGLYVSYDKGDTWDHLNHMALGQFYHVTVGPRDRYFVYGGLQDNGSWGGPNLTRDGRGPINSDWIRIGGGDGFICLVDPNDPEQIYFESQNGGMGRTHLGTGERGFIRPRGERGTRYRFNWRTPFILSPHNSKIYYTAGNHVFRSLNKGDSLKMISPDITNTDRGSATALDESPLEEGVIYVGTDDGALWATRDGGINWTNLFEVESGEDNSEGERSAGRGPRGANRIVAMLQEHDTDGDGVVAKADVPERMARLFDRIDTDSNGSVNQAELDAFTERMGQGEAESQGAGDVEESEASQPEAQPARGEDIVSGTWKAEVLGGESPGPREFEIVVKLGDRGRVTGELKSEMFTGEAVDGSFQRSTKKLVMGFEGEFGPFTIEGTVDDGEINGQIVAGGGEFMMDFKGERTSGPPAPRTVGAVAASETAEAPEPEAVPISELVEQPLWVSQIVASQHEASRVYVTLDGHRSDDDEPYVFVSEDYGETWRSIRANLPTGSTRTISEDIENENLLYVGTEFAAYASISRGEHWTSLNSNLPTVAVHAFAQHPTSGELVAGTHGRSIWILDVTTLRQMTDDALTASAHLFKPNRVTYWRREPSRGTPGPRDFRGENPDSNAQIAYMLLQSADKVTLKILELDGTLVRDLGEQSSDSGLNTVRWDLRRDSEERGGRRRRAPRVDPGTYRVVLDVDGQTMEQRMVVRGDPDYPMITRFDDDFGDLEEEEGAEAPGLIFR